MTDTNQLPCEREAFEAFAQNCPMGKYSITRRGDGYDSSHTQLMWDAWQARAQVQGELEPVAWCIEAQVDGEWFVQYPIAFTKQGAELDASHYQPGEVLRIRPLAFGDTTPQPAQATQAEVTDEQILEIAEPFGEFQYGDAQGHKRIDFARAILALRPEQSGLTGCNCRWDGDTQVQWCELHLAHKEAIHEWAERAKEAEKQLTLRPAAVPMGKQDAWDNSPVNSDWEAVDAYLQGIEDAEAHHGITAQAKKETP